MPIQRRASVLICHIGLACAIDRPTTSRASF
jgi:hypothetical protein